MKKLLRIFWPGAVLALFVPMCSATADNAANVYRKVSPSVVLIRTDDGLGSGVVVRSSGLIMTNLHVIHSHERVSVTAIVGRGQQRIEKTFSSAKVVSAHGDYDAALVKVKLKPGDKLIPIRPAKRALRTGSTCYAVGNPGGLGGALQNSISKGIVGAAKREVNGLSFIQTTAPINPGNSGGALVNAKGELIGITTFKINDTEGLGFAVPISNLKPSQFDSSHLSRDPSAFGGSVFSQLSGGGIAMIFAGLLTIVISSLWFLVIAFKENVLWGIAILFFNLAALVFLILNWREAKWPFAFWMGGLALFVSGFFVGLN